MNEALPKGWKTYHFGDFARMINEKVEPGETDLKIYVGLEHLDSDSLRIRRWGSPSDVIGGKLRVRPGDIIFGKRRAYQRKLAIADFDGICSAHAMVLRPNEEKVHKDFFPFFLQSDMFMERALDISVGSLSPTINWKTLKVQEFPLPPLKEQKRIAKVLWAVEESIRKTEDAMKGADGHKQTLMSYLFSYGIINVEKRNTIPQSCSHIGPYPSSWKLLTIGNITERVKQYDPSHNPGQLFNYIDVSSVSNITYSIENVSEIMGKDAPCRARQVVLENDVIMATVRPALRRIAMVPAKYDGYICSTGFIVLRAKHKIAIPSYLFYLASYTNFVQRLVASQTGTAYPAVSDSKVKSIKVPVPPIQTQETICNLISNIDLCIQSLSKEIVHLKKMKQKISNEVITGVRPLGGKSNV